MYDNIIIIISGDENHLCGASLRESRDFFESTQAWPNYNSMYVSQLYAE